MNPKRIPATDNLHLELAISRSELKKSITLHPKIAALVDAEVDRCNSIPSDKRRKVFRTKVTVNDVVNECLWLALRSGDITHHYTHHD
jgi:hypothetical protein